MAGCCGGRRPGGGGGGGAVGARVTINEPGESVVLAYQGDKRGTMSRKGPVTGTWYSFSSSPVNRTFTCAKADAEYLLRMGDLALVPQAAPQPVPAAPVPPAQRVTAPVPQVQPMAQPTLRQPVPLDEEPPADDLSEIRGITRDTAGILALIGVRTFAILSMLNKDGVAKAAQMTGKSEGEVNKWVKAAKAIVEPEEPEEVVDLSGFDGGDLGDLGADLPGDLQLADGEAEG